MKKTLADGRVSQAIITPRLKRNQKESDDKNNIRVLSTRQLMVLFYHFYIMINDQNLCGFNDAEKTAAQFQAELDAPVEVSVDMLEKLLYTLEIAYENELYWNPANEDFKEFTKALLNKGEYFDRLNCLILKKKPGGYFYE